jgi:hypothetical protein
MSAPVGRIALSPATLLQANKLASCAKPELAESALD